MTVALYEGLLNPPANASASIPIDCQSGNCTFPRSNEFQYSSLAMCSSVDDFSKHIIGDGVYNNYSMQGVPITTIHGNALSSVDITQLFYLQETRPLFVFEVLMSTDKCKNGGRLTTDVDCMTEAWAFIATLYPCIRTYGNAKVSESVFEERTLSTTALQFTQVNQGPPQFSLAGDYPSFSGTDCTSSQSPQGNKTQATSLHNNGARYANYSSQAIGAPDTQYYNPEYIYDFGAGATSALSAYLSVFFGTLNRPNNLTVMSSRLNDTVGDIWLQNLYRNGTADLNSTRAYMQALAESITGVIRQYGVAENSVPFKGAMLLNRTCIRVQWAWLALPIALLLLTFLFFVGIMIQSQRHRHRSAAEGRRGAWKSSSLPFLWCGLDHDTRSQYGGFDDSATMQERAESMEVRLSRRAEEGAMKRWKLREQ